MVLMKEATMQGFFGKWLEKNSPEESETHELKISKNGKPIPFSAVKPHQIEHLLKSEKDFYHRITDQPAFYGSNRRFTILKPFDSLFIKGAKGYIIVWWYVPRTPKVFIKIRVHDFIKLRDSADRKSMTEEMALSVGKKLRIS